MGAAVGLLCAVLVAASASTYTSTEDEVYALWRSAAQRFEAQHRVLSGSSDDSRWVQRIGGQIVRAWPDRSWVTHTFLVVDSPHLGAWSFPVSPVQHEVYVTTGLLTFIRSRGGSQRDDLLAGVLGHEIAHLMQGHHLLRYRSAELLGAKAGQDPTRLAAQVLGNWQEEDEFDADRYGAFYALHAGYDFGGMVKFLALYLRQVGDGPALDALSGKPSSGHPSLRARVARLQQRRREIEDAKEIFEWGIDLLRVGAWGPARDCFAYVRDIFVLSPTVAHNLAYAELKQYEDELPGGPSLLQCVSPSYVAAPFGMLMDSGAAARAQARTKAAQELLAQAEADFVKACDLDTRGGFLPPRLGLACIYLYEGDYARARSCLQEVRGGADDSGYLNLMGVLAEQSGDWAAARHAYLEALHLQAEADSASLLSEPPMVGRPYPPALYNLAHLRESEGDRSEAAQLYDLYLTLEGPVGHYARRAVSGLYRCGGTYPRPQLPELVKRYRGIELKASGRFTMETALGVPEVRRSLLSEDEGLVVCEYPSRGITFLLAPRSGGVPVVVLIALMAPHRDPVAGVRIGDPVASLQSELGRPREVTVGAGGATWWDYPAPGVAFLVEEGKIRRQLIGGRRRGGE